MEKKISVMRVTAFVGLAIGLVSPAAYADDRWFHHHHDRPYYWRETRRPSWVFSFYRHGPRSYVIVPAPVGAVVPAAAAPTVALQIIVVNVPNKNGSYMPVKLQAASNGTYIGPQGEVYPTQPTMEQLKQMYGQ